MAESNDSSSGRGFSIGAIACGVIAVLLLPIVFGPVGLVLGYLGYRRGDRLGNWGMVVAGVGMVLGFVLSALAFSQLSV